MLHIFRWRDILVAWSSRCFRMHRCSPAKLHSPVNERWQVQISLVIHESHTLVSCQFNIVAMLMLFAVALISLCPFYWDIQANSVSVPSQSPLYFTSLLIISVPWVLCWRFWFRYGIRSIYWAYVIYLALITVQCTDTWPRQYAEVRNEIEMFCSQVVLDRYASLILGSLWCPYVLVERRLVRTR